jgi:peptidase E
LSWRGKRPLRQHERIVEDENEDEDKKSRTRRSLLTNATNKPKPVFLLAGGGAKGRKTPNPLVAAVFAECATPSPQVAYIGAATQDDPDFFARMSRYLLESGAAGVQLAPVDDATEAARVLGAADAVFVSGGDVELGMRLLAKHGVVPLLKRRYDEGALFFGISAGSIMLAREWVRWRDPKDDATAETFPCLALAPLLCDTHGEEDGWEELHALLRLETDGTVGYGLPTATALRVDANGEVTAIGGAIHRFAASPGEAKRLPDLLPPE